MNRTICLKVVGGDPEALADRVDVWQSSARAAYNLVVDAEARTADPPGKFDAFKRLTEWRKRGCVGEGHTLLQRGAIVQALTSCKKHREAEGKRHRRAMLDLKQEGIAATWIHSLPDSWFPPDKKKECEEWMDALPKELRPTKSVRSAVLHQSRKRPPEPRSDKDRMRRRKDYEAGRHRPALFFISGVKRVDTHHVQLPGKVVVRVKGSLPEDIRSVQLVERTIHPQGRRGSGPCPNSKRRFSLHVQHQVQNPKQQPLRDALGVDLGVVNAAGTSDGMLYRFTDNDADYEDIAESQRRDSRKRRGSVAWRMEKKAQRRMWRKVTGLRQNESRHLALHLAESCSMLVLEDLKIENMRRSARGTISNPGRNVKAKRKLNNRLGRATLGRMRRDIVSAAERCGTAQFAVPPHGTSRTCVLCGHEDSKSRESQSSFRCASCGHRNHADVNAPQVVLDRGLAFIEEGYDPTGGRDGRPPQEVLDRMRKTLMGCAQGGRAEEVGVGDLVRSRTESAWIDDRAASRRDRENGARAEGVVKKQNFTETFEEVWLSV